MMGLGGFAGMAARGVAWWVDELAAAGAAALRAVNPVPAMRREFALSPDGTGTVVTLRGGTAVAAYPMDTNRTGSAPGIGGWRKVVHSLWPPPVQVSVTDSMALQCDMVFPLAVERSIENAIAFEIPRRFPFQSTDVCTVWRIVERNADRKSIVARVWVVPRRFLQDAVPNRRGQAAPSGRLVIRDAQGRALADGRLPGTGTETTTRLVLRLANVALLLGVVGMGVYLPFFRQNHLLADVQQHIDRIQPEAVRARALETRIAQGSADEATLTQWKHGRPGALETLAAITDLLPDTAWTYEVQYHRDRVELKGYAREANDLIGRLESHALVRRAEFASPVIRESGSGEEQFQIRADLVGAE